MNRPLLHPAPGGLALIALPVGAWAVQGLTGWWIGSRVCAGLTPTSAQIFNVVVTAVALAVTAAAGAAARRRYGQSFFGTASLFVTLMFALGIVWAGLSSGFLDHCGVIR